MNTSLATLVNQTLPAVSNSSVTYNADRNMFLTAGYTSATGNTYFQGIQLSNRLAIVLDIGVGYLHTFLNGLKLYCFDGTEKKLIGTKFFDRCFYNDRYVRQVATKMLLDYLKIQATLTGTSVPNSMLEDFAEKQVLAAAVNRPQLAG